MKDDFFIICSTIEISVFLHGTVVLLLFYVCICYNNVTLDDDVRKPYWVFI